MTRIPLPFAIHELVVAQRNLKKYWDFPKLKFTLDGRLVGDIAEAVAATEFGLKFPPKRCVGVDLLTSDESRTVQVKASATGKGPAFTAGRGKADYLIFMLIHLPSADNSESFAEIVYNGPESPIRDLYDSRRNNRKDNTTGETGTIRIPLSQVVEKNDIQTDRLISKQSRQS